MKFLSLIFFAIVASCQAQNLVELLQETNQETILSLLELTGLTETLEGEGPFTVFLPKQEVFDSLPEEVIEAITADVDALTQVLLYHVVVGEALSSALANELLLPTAQGADLRVNLYDVDGETVATVAGVPIDLSQVDIAADNGVAHFLDGVILNIPVGDTIETAGIIADDGVVTFDALAAALEGTGLAETLVGLSDVTVLAPIDSEGFNVEIVDELLADPEALSAILLDHVVEGTIFSAGLGASSEVTTLGGNTFTVVFTDEAGYVVQDADGNVLADVIGGDIPTTQGVLHVLDRPIIAA